MQDEAVTSRCHDMVLVDWQQIILKYLGVKLAIVSPVKEIQQIQL